MLSRNMGSTVSTASLTFVGTHLTHRDVHVLSFLFVDIIDDHERGLIRNGPDFLLALDHQGRCDESNFRCASSLAMTCCPRLLSRRDGLCAQILFWADYCQHETALQGNVFSNKQDPLERQFERFNQANTILKSQDLGSIICDIKFSELTYLDAFWRDYINGSLLEARKGVFMTDSLKQAVGHEAIKLLVKVDEEDYSWAHRNS